VINLVYEFGSVIGLPNLDDPILGEVRFSRSTLVFSTIEPAVGSVIRKKLRRFPIM
jgi:hypothetical protein